MINREDILELTRRMTPQRNCFSRIAGAYITAEGEIDETFNTAFLKLSGSDRAKNLALAKTVPFAETNVQLKEYRFPDAAMRKDSLWQLLYALKSCELKDDALLYLLYEQIADGHVTDYPYAVFVFFGSYDIPRKGTDREWIEGSEEVYDFLICTVSPLKAPYEPGETEFGFLFPAFSDRSADTGRIDLLAADPGHPHEGLHYKLFGERKK